MWRSLLIPVLVVLVIIGVVTTIARGLFLADLGARMEPTRHKILVSFRIFPSQRIAEVKEFDSRFGANPSITMLHILPGGFFLTFALLQFSPRIRTRHIQFHRWSGRIVLLVGLASAIAGLYFGILMPFAGLPETFAILLFGGLFLAALIRAFIAIQKKQVALHREWMIRAFAVAVGISSVRIVGILADIALTPAGFGSKEIFVISLWTGWILTVAAAELWIRHTRAAAVQTV